MWRENRFFEQSIAPQFVKHLFYIHSNITEIIALLAIKHGAIAQEDTLVITDRDHSLKLIDAQRLCVIDSKVMNAQLAGGYKDYKKEVKTIDEIVSKLAGNNPFQCYIPQSSYDVIKVIITHSRCAGYYYIEEGIGSYFEYNKWAQSFEANQKVFMKSYRYALKYTLARLFRKRLMQVQIKHDFTSARYAGSFVLDAGCLHNAPKKVVLELSPAIKEQFNQSDYQAYFDLPVLITDCYYEYSKTKPDAVRRAFEIILDYFVSRNNPKLLIKFHPKENHSNPIRQLYNAVITDYSEKLEIQLLPNDLSIEALASFNRNEFYYIYSSLGMYTKKLGAESHALVNEIAVVDEGIMAFYEKNYKSIFNAVDEVK